MTRTPSNEELFRIFVLQQQQWTMVALGKLVHPLTGESERDLEAARFAIDLLGMLDVKTKGNLTTEEDRLLTQVLANLRLNFLEESSRPAPAEPETAPLEGPGDPQVAP